MPNTSTIDITNGGTQTITLDAGKANANHLFWIIGSMTGTSPGFAFLGPHLYLNPDAYTDLGIALTNSAFMTNFRGALDANGKATASFNLPGGLVQSAVTVHHAALIYLSNNVCTTNPTPLILK